MKPIGASVLLCVAAAVVCLLAAFGATPFDASELDLVAFGLASFALAHIVP